jgi:hypothetical protein
MNPTEVVVTVSDFDSGEVKDEMMRFTHCQHIGGVKEARAQCLQECHLKGGLLCKGVFEVRFAKSCVV